MSGRIISLTGLKGSGKDAAAQALVEDGWVHLKFATPLVDMLKALDLTICHLGCWVRLTPLLEADYEGTKNSIPEVRRLLQRLGTEAVRGVLGDGVWVDHMAGRLADYLDRDVVISDTRFENEAELVRWYKGVNVEIIRPTDVVRDNHASEAGVPRELIDHTVYNTGTIEDLHIEIRQIAKTLL